MQPKRVYASSVASRFGPFELQRMLGRGGMAEAYIACRQGAPDHPLVIKRIRADFAGRKEYLRRFILEAQIASRLVHPNLVRFREFGRVGECHYIVMEKVSGHSLHRVLQASFHRGLRLPALAALQLGIGILSGLAAMHRVRDDDGHPRPFLHRDVTPANIIIDRSGTPILIDFGIAKDINGPSITLPGQVIGTARYMAPEHRRAEYTDARADVFSASVVLFELLVGRHPWPPLQGMKELLRTTFDPPEIPEDLRLKLPQVALDLILRGLQCQREDRFSDAEDMRSAFAKKLATPHQASTSAASEEVLDFIDGLNLPLDEALTGPVIDIDPPVGTDQVVFWSADGALQTEGEPPSSPPQDTAVLTIPPLPPARGLSISLTEAKEKAFGRPIAHLFALSLTSVTGFILGLLLFRSYFSE